MLRRFKASLALPWRAVVRAAYAVNDRDVAVLRGSEARLRVDPTTDFGQELLQRGQRESEAFLVPLLHTSLEPADVFVDVGAHWGLYSVVAALLVGPSGRVVAVEPYRASARRLRENLALNRCDHGRIAPYAVADYGDEGILDVIHPAANLNRLSATRRIDTGINRVLGDRRLQRCPVKSLDAILDEFGIHHVRVLKMDIEGGEWQALEGLRRCIDRIEVLVLETHPSSEPTEQTRALHAAVATERALFKVDREAHRIRLLDSYQHFEESLGEYYFISVGSSSSLAHRLLNFSW